MKIEAAVQPVEFGTNEYDAERFLLDGSKCITFSN